MNGGQAAISQGYNDHRTGPATPRRTEVDRLGGALDRLEKTMADHSDRIDPVLRPQPPMAIAGGQSTAPESRLASLVSRVDEIAERLGRITERVEA